MADAKYRELSDFVSRVAVSLPRMTNNAWFIGNDAEQKLNGKIGKPLWDIASMQ